MDPPERRHPSPLVRGSPSISSRASTQAPGKRKKTGLKKSFYSRNHFSSPYSEKEDGT